MFVELDYSSPAGRRGPMERGVAFRLRLRLKDG
jgi:hypothetical protein